MMEDIFRISLDLIEAKRVNGGGALLDVGCGYGFFMEAARQRGWRVFGVEPCAHARAYAASRSLEIDSEDLFARAFPPDMFDVVTLFYVLEHLPDPVGCLKEVYRVLKPGGTILLRLPHTTPIVKLLGLFGIPNKLYDVPSHLCDFSPLTIAVALRKTGFSDIKTFPGGATRPPKLSERVVSSCSGALADAVYTLSGDRLLLPGVSKTTIAKKTGSGNVQQ